MEFTVTRGPTQTSPCFSPTSRPGRTRVAEDRQAAQGSAGPCPVVPGLQGRGNEGTRRERSPAQARVALPVSAPPGADDVVLGGGWVRATGHSRPSAGCGVSLDRRPRPGFPPRHRKGESRHPALPRQGPGPRLTVRLNRTALRSRVAAGSVGRPPCPFAGMAAPEWILLGRRRASGP